MLLLPYPLYNPIHPLSYHFPYALIRNPSKNCATSSTHILGLTLYFYGRVKPPPLHDNENLFPYTIYLSLYIYISISHQIIASTHLLVSW